MKSLKKLASLLFALMLGASLAGAPAVAFADVDLGADGPAAVSGTSSVIDRDDLLSSDEISRLNSMAGKVRSDYDVAAVYLIVDGLDGHEDAQDYAEDFIDSYSLADATANGCVVFLLCVPEQSFSFVSDGKAKQTLSNDMLQHFVNEINPYLGRSDWAGAGETFFDDVSQALSGKQPNASSDIPYNGTYVIDDYKLFSDEQRTALEAKATQLAEQYNMGVYLLVVDKMNGLDNPTSAQRTNFATSFYRAHGLGLNKNGNDYGDGIMLVLAVKSRDYVTIAYGQGSYSFSDEGIEAMEEAVKDELKSDDWVDGAEAYYSKIGEQLEYYSVKGEPWTEPDPLSFFLKILAILGIPAGAAFTKINGEKSAMKTAREQTGASSYLDAGSFELTHSDDQFVNTSLTVTPRPKETDHDSGGGGFGGGGWGGGGGGGFSSSGGGKF